MAAETTRQTRTSEGEENAANRRRPGEDDELVNRARRGDTAAFDRLVERHFHRLYGLVYHMTSNREDAHDILQEVFTKAYRSLKRFRGKSSFYTWIYSIAVNMTLNFLKKRGRQHKLSLDDLNLAIEQDEELMELMRRENTLRQVNLHELQERLNAAMQMLSHHHRAVVTMHDIQGMPHAEIARILGISEGTVRSRLFYAHRELQNYLTEFRH